jgi:hypothetical protein
MKENPFDFVKNLEYSSPLKTVCEIDSTGPVRAISEGRVTASRIRQIHPGARNYERRIKGRYVALKLWEIPAIVATARRRGWIL